VKQPERRLPVIDVCIVSYRCPEELGRCLRACQRSAIAAELRVTVVDNASGDRTVELLRREFPWVRVVANARNVGFAAACNQGLRLGNAPYVLFLNPDTDANPPAFGRLAQFLETHRRAAAVSPRLVNEDGSLQRSLYRFPTICSALADYLTLAERFPDSRWLRVRLLSERAHQGCRQVEWATGACLLFRRSAWESVDGLDEGFFLYAEEMDLCIRLRQRGGTLWYCPEAQVVHKVGASTSQRPIAMVLQAHRSTFRFYRKHYGSMVAQVLRAIAFIANLARGVVLSLGRSTCDRRLAGKDARLYWHVVRLCLSRDWCDASLSPADATS